MEKTNHQHLGQLLTYAAGLDASTIIWISPVFTEEHRACLDWLNRMTDDSLRFFGVQLEAWRIGDSLPAPRFHLVAQPNSFIREIHPPKLGDSGQFHQDYWTAFNKILASTTSSIRVVKPSSENWIVLSPFGRTGFTIFVVNDRTKKRVRAYLNLQGQNASEQFQALLQYRGQIEASLGTAEWNDRPTVERHVSLVLEGADPADRGDWPRQHKWLAEAVSRLQATFSPWVKDLP